MENIFRVGDKVTLDKHNATKFARKHLLPGFIWTVESDMNSMIRLAGIPNFYDVKSFTLVEAKSKIKIKLV
jgi:hypothetical protein